MRFCSKMTCFCQTQAAPLSYPSPRLSKLIAVLRRIRIPLDPLTGTRLNFLLPYGSDQGWSELLQALPKLAVFFSSCIREEKTSGIMKTEQAEQLLKAEFSCSLG